MFCILVPIITPVLLFWTLTLGFGVQLQRTLASLHREYEARGCIQISRGKFESLILEGLSQIMMDLNKISSDIILFSMSESGFFEISSEICTGSSIMPHKKNPDALEILRANYHKITSYQFQIKSVIGNLISGYNRDVQLTKEPVINGFNLIKESLDLMMLIFEHLSVNTKKCEKAMTDELFATKKVYDLVEAGVPFREAYHKISKN